MWVFTQGLCTQNDLLLNFFAYIMKRLKFWLGVLTSVKFEPRLTEIRQNSCKTLWTWWIFMKWATLLQRRSSPKVSKLCNITKWREMQASKQKFTPPTKVSGLLWNLSLVILSCLQHRHWQKFMFWNEWAIYLQGVQTSASYCSSVSGFLSP